MRAVLLGYCGLREGFGLCGSGHQGQGEAAQGPLSRGRAYQQPVIQQTCPRRELGSQTDLWLT